MLSITDLKTGVIFEDGNEPWQVLEYQHSKSGRSGAVLRTKIKNLSTGATINKTFQASDKFQEIQLDRKKAKYLYHDNGAVFMDSKTYEQFNLKEEIVGNALDYIKEGDEIQLAFYNNSPLIIDLPIKVKLKVVDAPKTDKGNTQSSATKKIKTETELELNAPMFIKEGEYIIVDTRTGTYVERAK